LFHVTQGEVVGKTDYDLFPREIADAFRANDFKVIEAAAPLEFEEVVPQDDGPHSYISVKVPLLDESGRPYAVCGVSTDLSDRKRAQEAQARYETARRFMDDVSHEFRTPLTVIKEFTSILCDGLAGEVTPEQREYLEVIADRVDDLNSMVNDMLDIGRLDARLLGMHRREARVADIIHHISQSIERKANANKVDLEFQIDEDLPDVYCDPEKIGRVIVNLVVNAIKFSNEGGQVCVRARPAPHEPVVLISVSDNGPGISPQNMQAIFERFKQADSTLRASTKGFGLGLNIAKELVQLNLGEINVESQLGRGSTFSFSVPTADPCRVVARYLDQVGQRSDRPSSVSLVLVRAADLAPVEVLDDVDEFLQHLLRHYDLPFRTGPGAWLLVIANNQHDLNSRLDGIKRAWVDANRNRPCDALPAIRLDVLVTRRIEEHRAELLDAFRAAVEPMELVHA
jgi:hypothetical protein